MVAVLVCRKWRELGENPKLWTFLKLKIDRRGEVSILNIRRLQYLREIIVDWWKGKELEELFLALGKLSNLRKITIQHYINTYYLDNVYSVLTKEQLHILFGIFSGATKLKHLVMPGTCLSYLDPAYLAKTLSNIEELNISSCRLNNLQAETIMSHITASSK